MLDLQSQLSHATWLFFRRPRRRNVHLCRDTIGRNPQGTSAGTPEMGNARISSDSRTCGAGACKTHALVSRSSTHMFGNDRKRIRRSASVCGTTLSILRVHARMTRGGRRPQTAQSTSACGMASRLANGLLMETQDLKSKEVAPSLAER